jgi:hypothetical protein
VSAPPRVKIDWAPSGQSPPFTYDAPLPVIVELENLTATPSARYDYYWGDGNSNQGISAVSASHRYDNSGQYNLRVRIRDITTGFYGFDQAVVSVWRPIPPSSGPPPEGITTAWPDARPLNPDEPAFQVRRKSRPLGS